jgi:transcriptional regulator with XRE-family HTH domain
MSEPSAEALGDVLRRLRKSRGLTQRQLAAMAGTHVTHLSRLESGQRTDASRELLDRLGNALDAPAQVAAAAGRLPTRMELAISKYSELLDGSALEGRVLPAMGRLRGFQGEP